MSNATLDTLYKQLDVFREAFNEIQDQICHEMAKKPINTGRLKPLFERFAGLSKTLNSIMDDIYKIRNKP